MTIVTSAEAQKNGRYRERALAEPVVVTQYGKPSVVIISAAEYERLKELDRRVMRLDNMSDGEIEEMLDSTVPPEQRYSGVQHLGNRGMTGSGGCCVRLRH
jgi:PHD/YefM family antitoxin component YafN of YafNO toxin-antitoxin module